MGGDVLTILVPLGGSGRRFADAGYAVPKPLIDVNGAPMIVRVVESVAAAFGTGDEYRWVFVVRGDNGRAVVDRLSKFYYPNGAKFVWADEPTEGAACTCLLAREYVDTDDPLLVVNGDQIVSPESVRALVSSYADGAVLTMRGDGTRKWSYAKVDSNGVVTEVEEKNPVSDRATCGLYYFKEGAEFVRAAENMIHSDDRVNGEFYVAPVYNWLISDGHVVKEVRVEDHGNVFHGLGTPEDLERYLGALR